MINEQVVITDDGVRLSVRTKGNGDRCVIVPNAIYMEDAFDPIVAGRTLVFFDLRNRGRSERVTDPEKLVRGVLRDVDDLEAVRRHYNLEVVDVIAHSYPAYVAMLYAMRFPARVRRAVQISTMQPDLAVQYPPHLSYADAVTRDVFAALGRLQAAPPSVDPVEQCREAWRILRPLYVSNPHAADKLASWGYCELENERGMLRHFNEYVLPSIKALRLTADDYANASMPALVMHGKKDRSAPFGGGREWAMRLRNARFLGFEDVGHVPWVEAPEQCYSALDTFLNGEWPAKATVVQSLG
jgi:pimeloyl-ACP methyl ester carboxylesterase